MKPKAPDMFELALPSSGQVLEVSTREQADGSLYISYGAEIHQVYAKEEPLGLRMVLDGVTVLLPTIYDESDGRGALTGKLVRCVVDEGAAGGLSTFSTVRRRSNAARAAVRRLGAASVSSSGSASRKCVTRGSSGREIARLPSSLGSAAA